MSIDYSFGTVVGVRVDKEWLEFEEKKYDEDENFDVDYFLNPTPDKPVYVRYSSMSWDWYIAGVDIVSVMDKYQEGIVTELEVSEVNLEEKVQQVKDFCKTYFNKDVEPKVYGYVECS